MWLPGCRWEDGVRALTAAMHQQNSCWSPARSAFGCDGDNVPSALVVPVPQETEQSPVPRQLDRGRVLWGIL